MGSMTYVPNHFARRAAFVLGFVALSLALAGCAAGNVSALLFAVLMAGASVGLTACGSSHGRGDDGGIVRDGGDLPDGTVEDAGGYWESCCEDGVIDTCFCPGGAICNYGAYSVCDDGSCAYGECPGGDGGVDAGGVWEPCCQDGVIDTCFCPGGAECNYGAFVTCPDGSCSYDPSTCEPDAGLYDAGGPDAG